MARLRAVIEARDAELAALREGFAAVRADLEAERELRRRLELRLAELERRLRMDSSDSGTPSSKEPIGAKSAAARSVRNLSGSGGRTAAVAGSPAIRAGGWPGTRTRASARTRTRRRSAAAAAPGWTARRLRRRAGRRSWTCRSPRR